MKPIFFFDLDYTLMNTAVFTQALYDVLASYGIDRARAETARNNVVPQGFTLEKFLKEVGLSPTDTSEVKRAGRAILQQADHLIFPGIEAMLSEISALGDCEILTFGDEGFQQEKWTALTRLHQYFRHVGTLEHVVLHEQTKGDVVGARHGGRPSFFFDDTIKHLEEVLAVSPATVCVRACWAAKFKEMPPEEGRGWINAYTPTEALEVVSQRLVDIVVPDGEKDDVAG